MGSLLVRTEKELHDKVFKKAFLGRIWKINDSNGVSDVVIRDRFGKPQFIEYKRITGSPRDETPITHTYLNMRPQQTRFLSTFAPHTFLAILIQRERRVYIFTHDVVEGMAEGLNWFHLYATYGVGSASVDSPHELSEMF